MTERDFYEALCFYPTCNFSYTRIQLKCLGAIEGMAKPSAILAYRPHTHDGGDCDTT